MRSSQVFNVEQRIKGKRRLSLSIKIYCLADIVLCTPFWIWALYHVIAKHEPDFGAVTFALVIVACIPGLLSVHYYHQERDDRARSLGRWHCPMIVISHLLLCANWAAGAILDSSFWISSWMIVMSMLYALTAFLFGRWSYEWYNLFMEASDYGVLQDEYDKDLEKL